FIQGEQVQETRACRCNQYLAVAPPPPSALDKSVYGAGFVAYVVTMKCGDSLPLYRLAKQFQRIGVPIVRSTLNDLFHGAAGKLEALWKRMLQLIRQAGIVQADETPMLMQRPNKRGYIWTFIAENLIAYRFSGTRSGETAAAVLGGTAGTLVVDALHRIQRRHATRGTRPRRLQRAHATRLLRCAWLRSR